MVLNSKSTPGACKLRWNWIILSFSQLVQQSPRQTWLSSLSLCKERTFLMHKEPIHGRCGVAGWGLGLRLPFAMTQNSFRGQQECPGMYVAEGMWLEIFSVGPRSTQGNSWNRSTADAGRVYDCVCDSYFHSLSRWLSYIQQETKYLDGSLVVVLAFQVQLSSTV